MVVKSNCVLITGTSKVFSIASLPFDITPAIKYVTDVIPAKAGIQKDTGCRIMSGMAGFGYLVDGLILSGNRN